MGKMKKVLVTVMAAIFAIGLSMTVVAQESMETMDSIMPMNAEMQAPDEGGAMMGNDVAETMDAGAMEEIEPAGMEDMNAETPVEENTMDEPANEDAMYTYGNVVSAADGKITVMEYDFENDQDVEIPYTVDVKTVFQNLAGLTDIQAGDEVEIMYEEVNAQRVAKMVSKTTK